MPKDIVNSYYNNEVEKQKAKGYIVPEHGLAMIPLAGLGVPSTHAAFGLVRCPSDQNYSSRLYKAKWIIPDLSKKIPANILHLSLPGGLYPQFGRITARCQRGLCRAHLQPYFITTPLEISSQIG
jgi:hypothetical protein